MRRAARRPAERPAAEPAPSTREPRTWQGIVYRPCQAGAAAVRRLFQYAGAFAPALEPEELAWEAEAAGRPVGGVLVERRGPHGMIHGPVVVEPPTGTEPLEVAAQLVAAVLTEVAAAGLDTLYARPQGLDRVWVRAGFVPMPEATLPDSLRGRPGAGLHAWRRPGSYVVASPERGAPGFRARG
jgi:hypothetical protein